jgi:hypothetical protein
MNPVQYFLRLASHGLECSSTDDEVGKFIALEKAAAIARHISEEGYVDEIVKLRDEAREKHDSDPVVSGRWSGVLLDLLVKYIDGLSSYHKVCERNPDMGRQMCSISIAMLETMGKPDNGLFGYLEPIAIVMTHEKDSVLMKEEVSL